MRPVILAGPTASGKSALALEIAARDGGWVINADALQVYGCWRILTARPDAADCARVPHRLYGHVRCSDAYSVGQWLREIGPVIAAARDAGARPVIVGGSGLYLDALTKGLHGVPPVPPEVRARSNTALRSGRLDRLIEDLARNDPVTLAQIDRKNPMRVQRAWDVWIATGRGLAEWRRTAPAPTLAADDVVCIKLEPDIINLNSRIERRFQTMVERGALAEAARYLAAGFDLSSPAAKALGAAELIAHLGGHLSLVEVRIEAVAATRRYAKRQRTWLRNRMSDWRTLDPDAGAMMDQVPRE